jgi:hypothetical protein
MEQAGLHEATSAKLTSIPSRRRVKYRSSRGTSRYPTLSKKHPKIESVFITYGAGEDDRAIMWFLLTRKSRIGVEIEWQ